MRNFVSRRTCFCGNNNNNDSSNNDNGDSDNNSNNNDSSNNDSDNINSNDSTETNCMKAKKLRPPKPPLLSKHGEQSKPDLWLFG